MGRCDCDLTGTALPESVEKALEERGGAERLLIELPDPAHMEREVEFHKAMADVNRLRIMHILDKAECCPCVLTRMTGMSDSRLSYHLSKLERQGLVEHYREQNWRVYRITELGRASLI